MLESFLAGGGLVVCALLLLRLAVGARRRRGIDEALARVWGGLCRTAWRGRQRILSLRTRRPSPAANEDEAVRAAAALIRRVRRGSGRDADREGNVIRPHAFRSPGAAPDRGRDPDPPRTLH